MRVLLVGWLLSGLVSSIAYGNAQVSDTGFYYVLESRATVLRTCDISSPASCSNTQELARSPGFVTAVKAFIGTEEGNYLDGQDRTLPGQALHALSGVPQDGQSIPGGLILFAGCPLHDCADQAAAVVLNAHGVIEGIGFSGNHCSAVACDLAHHYLDFYVRRGPMTEFVISALTSWGVGIKSFPLQPPNPSPDDGLAGRTTIKLLD